MEIRYKVLSTTEHLTKDNKQQLLPRLYQKNNWQQNQSKASSVQDIITKHNTSIVVISTHNLLVIDFDTDESFDTALKLNNQLQQAQRCQLIVKSSRKGGHFYYANKDNSLHDILPQHTKQSILDVLTTEKHNVIAPTKGDTNKHIVTPPSSTLTPPPAAMVYLVNMLILENLPEKTYLTNYLSKERNSDDAIEFIKGYLADIVTPHQFNQFYSLPDRIPPQQSNYIYLQLSTRLGSDETIDAETYIKVMVKYNNTHERKTPLELRQEITDRMVSGQSQIDGEPIWRYDPNKHSGLITYTTLHRKYNTAVSVYFDIVDNAYLIEYKDSTSKLNILRKPSLTAYTELAEKITITKKDALRRNTRNIAAVEVIQDYSRQQGYCKDDQTYNTIVHNSYLNAFEGTQPPSYSPPEQLLKFLQYMWGDEYEYLLAITKYRYSTFEFSPVVTAFTGSEGSGKDISIDILTRGFNTPPQNLNYELLKDKHSNWQTEPNAIFSEVGSWQPYERQDLLAELKTVSGSNGKVTFRDMQITSRVVSTQIKIWVTGNEWVKLHTDPIAQRRIHIVYMPRPLEQAQGGPYTTRDIEYLLSQDVILNFYYWLGTECQYKVTPSDYKSAICRHQSEAYTTYIENVESLSDIAAPLLYSCEYPKLLRALKLFQLSLDDIQYKYTKESRLAVSTQSLKEQLLMKGANTIVDKTIDRLSSDRFGNKRLNFEDGTRSKYILIFGAPLNLDLKLDLIKD